MTDPLTPEELAEMADRCRDQATEKACWRLPEAEATIVELRTWAENLNERLRRIILARKPVQPGEPDQVECKCGITFTPLRCPAEDCQNEAHGLAVVTLLEAQAVKAARAIPVRLWESLLAKGAIPEQQALGAVMVALLKKGD